MSLRSEKTSEMTDLQRSRPGVSPQKLKGSRCSEMDFSPNWPRPTFLPYEKYTFFKDIFIMLEQFGSLMQNYVTF